jgi:sugar lactone lactonase YvrE
MLLVVSQNDDFGAFALPEATGTFETWAADVGDSFACAIDKDGNLFVAGTNLYKLSPVDGSVIWGPVAIGAQAHGLATDSNGNIFVAHSLFSNQSISKYDPTGTLVIRANTGANSRGVFVDGAGNVYVTYDRTIVTDTTKKFNNALTSVLLTMDYGTHTQSVYVGDDGKIYVVGNSVAEPRVKIFDTDGTLLNSFGPSSVTVTAIVVDAAGNFYIAEQHTTSDNVKKFNSAGVEQWGYAATETPRALELDVDGNLYVPMFAVGVATNIAKLDPDGNELWKTTGDGTSARYWQVRSTISPRIAGLSAGAAAGGSRFLSGLSYSRWGVF